MKPGYEPGLIADLLSNPEHYTTREAAQLIAANVEGKGWYFAFYDYHKAMKHPLPDIASKAYLRVIDRLV